MSKNSVLKVLGLVLLVSFIAAVPSYPTGIEIEPDGWTVSPPSEVPTGIEIEPDG